MKIDAKVICQSWQTHRLFWWTVVIPTLVAILYFGLLAADVYISEARFIVRSPDRQTASPLGMILKGAGFTRAQDDTYSVQEYMGSRDALEILQKKLNVRQMFAKGDIFTRFPGVSWDDSFENMYRYYQNRITAEIDLSSSIGSISVRAFSGADAQAINRVLLEQSEDLVNRLNQRARDDMIRFASHEVELAEKRAKAATTAMADYRNQKGVIDPEKQSEIPLRQIAKMQDDLIAAKSQLSQLQLLAKDNPQIPVLKRFIQTLEADIESGTARIAGGGRSLASKAADFQRLALEKEFADRQLASTLMSLEQARNEAQRQQLYLERIAEPNQPDEAMEPRRLRGILAVFVIGLIAWGVLSLLVASIHEHQD